MTDPFFYSAVGEAWANLCGPSSDGSKLDVISLETIQAGGYIIDRGTYRFFNADGSDIDVGK